MIEKFIFFLSIVFLTIADLYFIYKTLIIIVLYEKIENQSTIKINNLYSLLFSWLFTSLVVLILLKIYNFI